MQQTITTKQMPNAEFIPFVIEQLESYPGKTVTLPLRGRSMRPFLEDGRDKALLVAAKSQTIAVGDAVLAEISTRCYVLHRIIKIEGQNVTLRGDGNLACEYCELDDVKAKAIAFFRKGRTQPDSTNGTKWLAYSWLWTRLYPIRRYLLFLFHPHIPARFRKGADAPRRR